MSCCRLFDDPHKTVKSSTTIDGVQIARAKKKNQSLAKKKFLFYQSAWYAQSAFALTDHQIAPRMQNQCTRRSITRNLNGDTDAIEHLFGEERIKMLRLAKKFCF